MDKKEMEIPKNVRQGIKHFNNFAFYEAHEFFEDAWRETSESPRDFYRALLHMSGGFYRLTQGRPIAARKFFIHALSWLKSFPNNFLGFDNAVLQDQLKKLIETLDQNLSCELILETHFHPIKITDHH
jgi:predicted metal-dependent hydrolase